ncbi:MAG: hypothetical protein ACT4P6_11235 [Gemmatimonadaceae bacterium]
MKQFVSRLQQSTRDLPAWSLWLMLVAIGIGAALRLHQFTADSSLWLDELAIANNLAERAWWNLLREPLGYAQVAPPGFIAVEKAMYELFGPNDRALRLYSLLAGIGALGAIALVGLRVGLRESAWVAPLLLALGAPFIFQSVQVKPYAGDVFFSLAIVAVALRLGSEKEWSLTWPLALGVLAPWFSFAASLTLAGVGVALLLSLERRRHLPIVALWGVSVVASLLYASSLVDRATADSMQRFWSVNGVGFPGGVSDLIPWAVEQLRAHLWSELGLRGVTYWLGIAGVGVIALWRRNRFALAIVAAPILVAFLAAVVRRYPLGGRLSHWIAALLILLVVAAAAEAAQLLRRLKRPALAPVPGMAIAALPLMTLLQAPPPYRIENVKPVLAEIARLRQPDDWLYVYSGAWHAYRYYGELSGIPGHRIVLSLCPRESLRESLAPFDAIRGQSRVWVLFTHVSAPRERALVLGYLDRIGVRRLSVSTPRRDVSTSSVVDAHLYDLSDQKRRHSVTWSTYPIAETDAPNERTICAGGMVPRRATLPRIERAGAVARDSATRPLQR